MSGSNPPRARADSPIGDPLDDPLDDHERAEDETSAGPLGDVIRRLAAVGLSGFFTTESALRRAVGETMPQDWVDFVSEQSDRGRQELFDRLVREMGRILEDMDLEELLENLVTDRTIEIEAKVRIRPREGGRKASRRRHATDGSKDDEKSS